MINNTANKISYQEKCKKLRTISYLCILLLCAVASTAISQNLDGRPYRPGIDPDIDMNIASWKDSAPYLTHGNLQEWDILTKGDPLKPPKKGAVLKHMNRFTRALLDPGTSTEPTTLKSEQEIFYILSGRGEITQGGVKAELYPGIAVLMPSDVEFTLSAAGSEPLMMYLICEPVPEEFTPNKSMRIRDENILPYRTSSGHWSHIPKELFLTKDGLATLEAVLTVAFAPMTLGHPHSHDEFYGSEEVWTGITGTSIVFIGKQIRKQPPGTAYNIPPDGNTPHSNINITDQQVKLFYFAVGAGEIGSGERFGGDSE